VFAIVFCLYRILLSHVVLNGLIKLSVLNWACGAVKAGASELASDLDVERPEVRLAPKALGYCDKPRQQNQGWFSTLFRDFRGMLVLTGTVLYLAHVVPGGHTVDVDSCVVFTHEWSAASALP
jgi:hypothetical protein